ncbi:MAG: hypothetical protein VW634_08995, partial [Paracoccaceae bacterium]
REIRRTNQEVYQHEKLYNYERMREWNIKAEHKYRANKNNKSQEKQIDPDNPFAKALMGFKQEN